MLARRNIIFLAVFILALGIPGYAHCQTRWAPDGNGGEREEEWQPGLRGDQGWHVLPGWEPTGRTRVVEEKNVKDSKGSKDDVVRSAPIVSSDTTAFFEGSEKSERQSGPSDPAKNPKSGVTDAI